MKRLLAACFAFSTISSASLAQVPEIGAANAAVRANPNDLEAARRLGRTLVRAGHYDEARRAYRRATTLARNSPQAMYEEASVTFARGDFRAARNACRSLEARHGDSIFAHVCLARSYLVINRSEQAFQQLELAARIDPNDYELQLATGEAHRIRMNFDQAEAAYRAALRARPDAAAPHLGLGRLYLAAGRRDQALNEFRDAQSFEPSWPEAQAELGALLGGAEGLELLRRAAEGCPTSPANQHALGEAELAAGNAEAAREAFAMAVHLDDQLAPAWVGLGRALTRLHRDAEAETALQRGLAIVPNSTPSYMALAEIHARADRAEDAYEDYRRAADISPGDPAPLLAGARFALQNGRDTLAQAFLDRLLAMNDSLGDALALYGDVKLHQRDFRAAITAYERALATQNLGDRPRVEASLADARARAAAAPTRR